MSALQYRIVLTGCLLLLSLGAFAAERAVPAVYPTVQAAVLAAEEGDEVVIAPGIYREFVRIHTPGITLRGTGAHPSDVTIVEQANWFDPVDGRQASITLYATADVTLRNLRVINAFDEPAERAAGGRAHTLAARFDGAVFAERVIFVGWSDTLNISGNGRFDRVKVLGTNDVVWGKGNAVFRRSAFVSRGTGAMFAHGGEGSAFFVHHSSFRSAVGERYWLARPWGDASAVHITDTHLDEYLVPEGFKPNPAVAIDQESTVFYECDNRGPGATMTARVDWATRCGT